MAQVITTLHQVRASATVFLFFLLYGYLIKFFFFFAKAAKIFNYQSALNLHCLVGHRLPN